MAVSSLLVAVLCCDGLVQRHLVRRASEDFTLVGVVLQVSPPASRSWPARLAKYRRPLRLLPLTRSISSAFIPNRRRPRRLQRSCGAGWSQMTLTGGRLTSWWRS